MSRSTKKTFFFFFWSIESQRAAALCILLYHNLFSYKPPAKERPWKALPRSPWPGPCVCFCYISARRPDPASSSLFPSHTSKFEGIPLGVNQQRFDKQALPPQNKHRRYPAFLPSKQCRTWTYGSRPAGLSHTVSLPCSTAHRCLFNRTPWWRCQSVFLLGQLKLCHSSFSSLCADDACFIIPH